MHQIIFMRFDFCAKYENKNDNFCVRQFLSIRSIEGHDMINLYQHRRNFFRMPDNIDLALRPAEDRQTKS